MDSLTLINILIVSNSNQLRVLARAVLDTEPYMHIIDMAEGTAEMLIKMRSLRPEVVLLDSENASYSQFNAIMRTANELDIQIVTFSRAELNDRGALLDHILTTARGAESCHYKAGIEEAQVQHVVTSLRKRMGYTPASHLIVIGASTGGVSAIEHILSQLSADFTGAILIAQHLPPTFTASFTRRLQNICCLPVAEGKNGMQVEAGMVIVASGKANMQLQKVMGVNHNIRIEYDWRAQGDNSYDRPSIDVLMHSAASLYGENTMGVILSGMGRDGCEGAAFVRGQNGVVLGQNRETSVIFGMAHVAWKEGHIDHLLPLQELHLHIQRFTKVMAQPNLK